jgi:hypothetical protein
MDIVTKVGRPISSRTGIKVKFARTQWTKFPLGQPLGMVSYLIMVTIFLIKRPDIRVDLIKLMSRSLPAQSPELVKCLV